MFLYICHKTDAPSLLQLVEVAMGRLRLDVIVWNQRRGVVDKDLVAVAPAVAVGVLFERVCAVLGNLLPVR